jgi:hypothetical protein
LETHAELSSPRADARPSPRKRRRLGKQLIKQGIVPKSVVRAALEEQEVNGARLGEILVARGAIDGPTLAQALAYQDVVGLVTAADRPTPALPVTIAFEHRAVALETGGKDAGGPAPVAVTDLAAVPAIWESLGQSIEPKLADADTMERLLSAAYPDGAQDESVDDEDSVAEPAGLDLQPTPAPASVGKDLQAETLDAVAEAEAVDATPVTEVEADAARESDRAPEADGASNDAPEESPGAAAAPLAEPSPARAPIPPARRAGLLGLFSRRSPAPAHAPRSVNGTSPATVASRASVGVTPPPPAPVAQEAEAAKQPAVAVASTPDDVQPAEPVVAEIPDATVIVGLRQASPATLMRLREVLESIEYPREHLQVVAVQDPADHITRRALREERLPAWVTEAIVSRTDAPGPRGMLLCGLRRARGELVMVVRAGSLVDPSLLRNVASGLDEYALMSRDELTARRLTNAFLRQAEPPRLEPLAYDNAGTASPECVFRTAELREAFGWTHDVPVAHF